jgi:hypothetical protein
VVDLQYAAIFKGIFESSNPAQNGEFFAEIGLWEPHDFEFTILALTTTAA